MLYDFKNCSLCPRQCHANRTEGVGFCGVGDELKIARAALHMWEEPCISGKRGSGTVFFVGCNLGCNYCQNRDISRGDNMGMCVSAEKFREICFELRDKGAHNINLVTPCHFAPILSECFKDIKKELGIPVVCNTGGYDSLLAIDIMAEFTDVFLPDFKYASAQTGRQFSNAPDYPEIALAALKRMVSHTGKPVFSPDGILLSGTVVRHLVLPGQKKDGLAVMDALGSNFAPDEILVSVMRQYTPREDATGTMARRVTSYEYDSVVKRCAEYGFGGFVQGVGSASEIYRPAFDLTGII